MSLEHDLRNLSRIPLFAELEPDARSLLAFSAETRILRTGDVVFLKGEPSDGGYVILSGSIALTSDGGMDRYEKIVEPYILIGEIAVISQTERVVTAIAREPSVVLKISRSLFHRILREFPQSATRIREVIAKRLRDFSIELEDARCINFSEPDSASQPRSRTTGT